MSERFYVFGTGAHARKVAHYMLLCGADVTAFVDDALGATAPLAGIPVIHSTSLPEPRLHECMFVAVGAAGVRQRLMEEYAARGWPLPALVHPAASVACDARLADGVLVAAGAVVETGAVIGRGVIVDIGVLVDHDCEVGDFCHLRPGEVLVSHTVRESPVSGGGAPNAIQPESKP